MDIKIYIDGKLDIKNERRKAIKKALWHTYVWLDCVMENKRLRYTSEEKEAIHGLAMSFARGERRPF